MNGLKCHSLRTVPNQENVSLCAHPKIHAMRNLVTRSVCKGCPMRTKPAPKRFRSVTFRADGLRERPEIQLVVAHYQEDLDWLDQFQGVRTIVYDKGNSQVGNPLPNIGREAHTYLHHIVANYDQLASITVFLQGDPYAHVAQLHERIWSLEWNVGFQDLCDHILIEDGSGEPVQPGIGLDELYEKLFDEPSPEFFLCHSAACFAVSRRNIHSRPLAFYERALQLVLDRPMGPWEMERLWQYVFRTRVAKEGVATAADADFFRDLQLFIQSYQQRNRYPLVVIDLGLHEEQRRWCLEQPSVSVLPMPQIYAPVERIRQRHWWQAWLKPFYICHAPFDRVLWIDADCTIVGELKEAFVSITQQPLLVQDGTIAVTKNNPELYRYLPLPEEVEVDGINVNSGVVGLCKIRDSHLLNAWAFGVAWAAMNPDKQGLSAWADQGILLWAALKTGCADVIRKDFAWNCPVDSSTRPSAPGSHTNLMATAISNGHSILEEIRRQYSAANIVHWLGPYKLSRQLENEMERLFLQGAGAVPFSFSERPGEIV